MIKKLLKQGLNKTKVARRLGISRETVRKYAKLPDGYVAVVNRAAVENIVDPYFLSIFPNITFLSINSILKSDVKVINYKKSIFV